MYCDDSALFFVYFCPMITLRHLAEQLNVSVSTVSKALSNSEEISKDTIERVKALADELNYQPNRVALSLKNNETRTIGVIIPNILNRFFAKSLFGIEQAASEMGYSIITCMSNELFDKECDSISLLSNGSVDGFIVAVSEETLVNKKSQHLQQLIDKKIPLVMFDRNLNDISCDKVVIDDYKITFDLAKMFINQGRECIAFMSTIDDLNVGVLRSTGYEQAISAHGQTPIRLSIKKGLDYQEQIKQFLQKHPKIDVIIAADNISGTTAVNVASSLNYKIPENLSIIGFADEVVSNLSVPKLSYINQNAVNIGSSALKLIVEKLREKDIEKPDSKIKIPVDIVHKGTT